MKTVGNNSTVYRQAAVDGVQQREGFNPCRIRPQNLAHKKRNINVSGRAESGGYYAGPVGQKLGSCRKSPDSFSGASPPSSLLSCNLLLNIPLLSSFTAGIDGLKKSLSVAMKTKQTFVFGFLAVVFALIFAACGDNGDPSSPPNNKKPETPVASVEYCEITWNLNGGSFAPGSSHPTQIEKGAVLAKPSPDPARTGYHFNGWYTNSSLTQTYTFADHITAGLTLYVNWAPVFENVSFEPVDFSGSKSHVEQQIKGKIAELVKQSLALEHEYTNLPATDPSKTNGFAGKVITRQQEMRNSYNGASVKGISGNVSNNITYMHGQLTDLLPEKDRSKHDKQIKAFKEATALDTRTELNSDVYKDQRIKEFMDAWAAAMGNEPMPASTGTDTGSFAAAAARIKQVLLESMPQEAGQPSDKIIEQIQDFAKFIGWTQDVQMFYNLGNLMITDAGVGQSNVKLANFKVIQPSEAEMVKATARKEDTAG